MTSLARDGSGDKSEFDPVGAEYEESLKGKPWSTRDRIPLPSCRRHASGMMTGRG
jgi:hypothetical protein